MLADISPEKLVCSVDSKGCWIGAPRKELWSAVSRPGVEWNTEYSSANVGVQPLRFSKLELFFGVSKVGLVGNWPDVGVCVGVGG